MGACVGGEFSARYGRVLPNIDFPDEFVRVDEEVMKDFRRGIHIVDLDFT